MFYLSRIEHTLPLPPSLLTLPIREALHGQGYLFYHFHFPLLPIFLYFIYYPSFWVSVTISGYCKLGSLYISSLVVFNLVMFRPFVGEVIAAKLLASNADGLR
ncbi:hypothetical protein Lal_00021865, partial [Lupinus albus]